MGHYLLISNYHLSITRNIQAIKPRLDQFFFVPKIHLSYSVRLEDFIAKILDVANRNRDQALLGDN